MLSWPLYVHFSVWVGAYGLYTNVCMHLLGKVNWQHVFIVFTLHKHAYAHKYKVG